MSNEQWTINIPSELGFASCRRALPPFAVPITPAILTRRTENTRVAARGRVFRLASLAASFLGLGLLLYLGLDGRKQALLQARLDDLVLMGSQLQHRLDDAQAPSNPEVRALLDAIKARLVQFDSEFPQNKLSPIQELEFRLTTATAENAHQKFADALRLLTDADEKGKPLSSSALTDTNQWIRILQVRGDSYFGLRDWTNALPRYRQILVLQPQHLAASERLAQCHASLGNSNEATVAYRQFATTLIGRGDESLLQGKTESARSHYARAIAVQAKLAEKEDRTALETELAASLDRRGNSYLIQRKPDAASADFQNAIDLQTRRVEPGENQPATDLAKFHLHRGNALLLQGTSDAAILHFGKAIGLLIPLPAEQGKDEKDFQLATSHQNRGNAFLIQEKPELAIDDFDQAIELLSRRLKGDGEHPLADDLELARSFNNRGVVHRGQGKPDAALQDFEKAFEILVPLIQGQSLASRRKIAPPFTAGHGPEVRLDVSMGYTENAIEALVRTRITSQTGTRDLTVLLAVGLRNRGYVHLAQGNAEAALTNFLTATRIYGKLVDQEGEEDLAPQFSRSLGSVARIYATHPEAAARDATKAKQYGLRAWELSQGKSHLAADTLAAAYAESGSFTEAIQWQEKALALAPAKYQAEVRSRLELYRSGKPYRPPGQTR